MTVKGWRIRGIVQGVGFRYFALREGVRAGLKGYVRNLPNGSVEAAASGPEEALETFGKALSAGPPQAAVYEVTTFEPSEGLEHRSGFDIEY